MKNALLDILCCPMTHRPLKKAPRDLLESVNRRIADRDLVNRDGSRLTEPLKQGLVTLDGAVLYPVIDDIPNLLPGAGIPLKDG